ncbi:MAG: hypothetical protein RSH52_36545, partial [Janthinobacterium sp.]
MNVAIPAYRLVLNGAGASHVAKDGQPNGASVPAASTCTARPGICCRLRAAATWQIKADAQKTAPARHGLAGRACLTASVQNRTYIIKME